MHTDAEVLSSHESGRLDAWRLNTPPFKQSASSFQMYYI